MPKPWPTSPLYLVALPCLYAGQQSWKIEPSDTIPRDASWIRNNAGADWRSMYTVYVDTTGPIICTLAERRMWGG